MRPAMIYEVGSKDEDMDGNEEFVISRGLSAGSIISALGRDRLH
jgi:hypothetical protein